MISVLNQVMEVTDIEHRILRVIRMERRDPEWPNSSKRPLKVKCNDIDAKFKFLKKAYKLKETDDELVEEIRISNDRTPQEPEKYRQGQSWRLGRKEVKLHLSVHLSVKISP